MRWTRSVRQWLVAALALFFACAADPPSRDPSAAEVATSSSEAELRQELALHFQRDDYGGAAKILEELVARFPKKQYWLQLSLVYATIGKDQDSLAALEVAYGEGYLTESRELVRLAQMYLFHEVPFKAAEVLEKGFADGVIDKTKENYELLANSLIRAQRLDEALDPLERAEDLSQSGDLYLRHGPHGDFWIPGEFERALREKEEQL